MASESKTTATEIGAPEFVTDLADLASYDLPDRVLAIIEHGRIPGEHKEPKDSRSEWLFDGVCQMVRFGVPDEVILGLLLDERWGISESVLDKPEDDQHRYATRQIVSAHRRIDGDAAKNFEDAPPLAPEDIASDVPDLDVAQIGRRNIAELPPTPWLVEGLLLYRAVTVIGGPGAAGKSVLALQIATSVALGTEFGWWRAPKRKRSVLVLSAEDDEDEVERRVAVACQLMKVDRAALPPNLLLYKQRHIRLVVKDLKTGKISHTPLWHQVARLIDENDVKSRQRIMTALR